MARLGKATLVALSLLMTGAAGASATSRSVHGGWQNPDALAVEALDPISGSYRATGVSNWQGTWRGTTTFSTEGTTNLITGETRGTVDEIFTGKTPGGRRGSLHFLEEFTVEPFTGAFHLVAHVKSGTGDFKGSRGTVTFVGTTEPITGRGAGTYSGTWRYPRRR
jgi:hypothetical protein